MPRFCIGFLAALGLLLACGMEFGNAAQKSASGGSSVRAASRIHLRSERESPSDLEIGGELAGLPSGTTRYLTREDLLALPQVSFTVTDDSNFTGPTEIGGVPLVELTRALARAPATEMAIAICDDKYRASYPREYVAAHRPLLVLTINGEPPSGWPKDSEGHGFDMGPYLISHPQFKPSFKILSHADEPQIPWGVVRIEFRDENKIFSAIAPHGARAGTSLVQAGYRIAQQNCFRCHNSGDEGGQKSGVPWLVLSAWAMASPDYFFEYVRDPTSQNPHAQMPGNSNYNKATIDAVIAYFQAFSSVPAATPPPKGKP